MEEKEAVTIKNFKLKTMNSTYTQAIAEEMDGLGSIPFERVIIPSGGGLTFELPGEEEDHPNMVVELIAIILDHHPINVYWKDKYNGSKEQPDCSSHDGKKGLERETGEIKDCLTCPYNQFGSDGEGKACKNVHRLYLLRENNPIPLILSLPPTSLKYIRDYIGKRILLKGLRCWQVITKITLKKEKNANGIAYSRAVFTFLEKLKPEQMAQVEAMREVIKTIYRTLDIDDSNDYNLNPLSEHPDIDGFVETESKTPEKVAFSSKE